MSTKRDHAIDLATQIRDAIGAVDQFERMPLGAIDSIITDLRSLRSIMGACPDIDQATRNLEKMKRPRADKSALGKAAKDAIVGALMAAYNMPT